jgi:hypothetical protein
MIVIFIVLKVQQRYALQVSDTTMLNRISVAGNKIFHAENAKEQRTQRETEVQSFAT